MAGLEGVVRPFIFPDIRPRPRPALPPEDDPTKGFAVISGNPAGGTSNSYSYSVSASYAKPRELWRRVDGARVFQIKERADFGGGGGDTNKDNYVDIDVANKIAMEEPTPDGGTQMREYFYRKVQEDINIEITRHDHILRSGETVGGGAE